MSLTERFREAPPRTQLLLWAGLGLLVLALLVALYLVFLRRPYDVLFNNLRTMDAATIVAQLDKDKIPYRLEDHGTTILVPENIVDQTRLNVMSADLPLKGMVGFELFNKSDMGLTEFAQRINYQRALQGELARTIMTLDTVDTARVHLSLPEPTVFREDRRPPRASVTIQTRPGKLMSAGAVRGVQRLVAAAVPELAVGDVVILDQAGEEVSGASLTSQDLAGADYADQGVESFYAAKISEGLARSHPQAEARVQVWADVDLNSLPRPGPDGATETAPTPRPGERPYRLRVLILVTPDTSSEERQTIRSSAIALAGLDVSRGDILSISSDLGPAALAPLPGQAATPVGPGAAQQKIGSGPSSGIGLMISAVLAVALSAGAVIVFVTMRGRRSTPMAEAEREAMTRDLKRMLDERMADALRS